MSNITLIIEMFTCLLGAILVSFYHYDKFSISTKMSKILKFYWFIWNQSLAYSVLVTVTYWLVLHKGKEITLVNVLVHGINFLALSVDAVVSKHPRRLSNLPFSLFITICYLTFTLIYTLAGGLDK